MTHDEHQTEFDALAAEADAFWSAHPDLPQMSADELMHELWAAKEGRSKIINAAPTNVDELCAWLSDFVVRWEHWEQKRPRAERI